MKSSLLLSSLASAALLVPTFVMAQQPEGPPPGAQMNRQNPRRGDQPPPPMRDRMQRPPDMRAALGLTEAQQAEIRKNNEAARRARLLKSTDLKVAKMDLASLLRADTVDEKAVAAKLVEVQAAQGALLKLRVDSLLTFRKILTPEQRKQMTEMRRGRGPARMNQRMNQRMNNRGRRGMGRGDRGMGTRPAPVPRGNPGDVSDLDLDSFDLETGGPAASPMSDAIR